MTNSIETTTTPIAAELHIPSIAETLILVKLRRTKPGTRHKVSEAVTDEVRELLGDESITVNSNTFQQGPVKDILLYSDRGYRQHKRDTSAWVDAGPRIMPGANFLEYCQTQNEFKTTFYEMAAPIKEDWDYLVQQDMQARLIKCKDDKARSIVSLNDYPSKEDAQEMFVYEFWPRPVPTAGDFRTEVPQYAKDMLNEELEQTKAMIRRDIIIGPEGMLKPIKDAAQKLSVPIGEKGSIFRDSLIENLQEQLYRARKLNNPVDPVVSNAIEELNIVLNGVMGSAESMRTQEGKRAEAAKKLNDLKDTITNLF